MGVWYSIFRRTEMQTDIWWVILKEKDHMKLLGLHGKVYYKNSIIGCALDFIWLWIGTSGPLLCEWSNFVSDSVSELVNTNFHENLQQYQYCSFTV